MVYIKEDIKNFLSFLDELDIVNYSCFHQKKYIISHNVMSKRGRVINNIEVYIKHSGEQKILNNYLRKRTR